MTQSFKRPVTRRAVVIAAAGTLASAQSASADDSGARRTLAPDLVLSNGQILTMDDHQPRAQALAISNGRIAAVGSDAEIRTLVGPRTRVINLAGHTVIPGLTDCHTHAIRGGQSFRQETYWFDEASLHDALASISRETQRRTPGDWVAVVGAWHPNQFAERRSPTVADLTSASPSNPVYVQYLYDHAILNERGIAALSLNESTTPPVPGVRVERDGSGRATGTLFGDIGSFNALVAKILPAPAEEKKASLASFFAELNSCGITSFIDDSAGPEAAYEPLFSLRDEGDLTLRAGFRVPAQTPGAETSFFESLMAFRSPYDQDGLTPFVGLGEVLTFGSYDGAVNDPGFHATPSSLADLQSITTLAAMRRIPLELHAYTDDAGSQILDVLEKVNQTYPIADLRWAMAHLNTGSVATIRRMKVLGMALSVQMSPYFEAPAIRESNGAAVAARSIARIALDEGLLVAGGTDATRVGDFRMWPALQYHVTGASAGNAVVRPPDQRLSRIEALRMYTLYSAWLAFADQDRGSITAGKLADLAVLDRPYLRVPASEIGRIRSVFTLLGGRAVHDQYGWMTV